MTDTFKTFARSLTSPPENAAAIAPRIAGSGWIGAAPRAWPSPG